MQKIRGLNRIRVVKYKRVSTDEQKLKKNSIIAQDEILDEYIKNNQNLVLVGDFSDEGVSGSKINRTDLQRLLEMVENDQVDLILVTKLDRWFRNIAFYYKIQEILERKNVAWKTVLEEYDTLTADGRLKVNIMLSVAQNEVERTSERIKVVFESKIKHKQAISGALPLGFTTVAGNGARKVVKDPKTECIVYDLIEQIKMTHSVRESVSKINDKYGLTLLYGRCYKLLKNPLLYGEYRGVLDYCEAYVTKDEFDEIQRCISKNIRHRDNNRTYIFSGLLVCPKCGRRLSGSLKLNYKKNGKVYKYLTYRCPGAYIHKMCSNNKIISENSLERKLLEQVMPQLENLILQSEIKNKEKKPKINKTLIKDEMNRLNIMFQKGRIKEDEYDQQYEALEKKLFQREEPQKDYRELKKILNDDLKNLYKTFSSKEKQIFWRSIIDTITIEDNNLIINFL